MTRLRLKADREDAAGAVAISAEPLLAIEPEQRHVIDDQAFASAQHIQATIAEPSALVGEFRQPDAQAMRSSGRVVS